MAAPLYRIRQLAAKVETVAGSAESLANSDAGILVEDVRFKLDAPELARNPLRASLSRYKSIAGPRTGTVTFRCELKGSGTAVTPPAIGKYIQACGFDETVETDNVLYTLTSTDTAIPTLTMAMYNDDTRWLMYGARGNVSFEGTANQIVYANFTFTGIYSEFTAVAKLTSVTYESTIPPVFRNTSTTFNFGTSYSTGCFSRWTLDMGNEVMVRENANAANGLSYARIASRDPGGTFDIDIPAPDLDTAPDVTPNFVTNWLTPTTGSLAMVIGSAAGNRIAIAAPALQVVDIADGDRGGVSVHDLTYKLRLSSTDNDELTINFY
jgi:hypothetical protein